MKKRTTLWQVLDATCKARPDAINEILGFAIWKTIVNTFDKYYTTAERRKVIDETVNKEIEKWRF